MLEHYETQSEEEAVAEDERLLAVQELASLSLPVASPEEMQTESCPAPDDLFQRPLGSRIGHLRGQIELPLDRSTAWLQRLRSRNWRS